MKRGDIQELITATLHALGDFVTTMVRNLGPNRGAAIALICLWSILAFAAFMGTRFEDLAIRVLQDILRAALAAVVWRIYGLFSGWRLSQADVRSDRTWR